MLKRSFGMVSAVALGVAIATGCSSQTVSSPPAPDSAAQPADTGSDSQAAPQSPTGREPAAVFAESGVAIAGADPVAYFTQDQYIPGDPSYTHEWGGATWQFTSADHRDRFAANPEQYAPQYGGFCAWAVSQGYTAAIDPTAWTIVDGKLYLNYDQNVQQRWSRDIPGNIAKANQNWPGVLDE